VGFVEGRLPFAFRNGAGELVGLDVELAHLLARDLDVAVEFVPFPAADLLGAVSSGLCDIAIGGQPVTPRLALGTRFSKPYLDETLAFLVRDHLRDRFATWDAIRAIDGLVIGVPPLPYYVRELRDRLPAASLESLDLDEDPLGEGAFDVVAYTAERGAVLTMLHPAWTVVVPRPGLVEVPLAFPIGRGDEALARFVDTWIDMKRRDGTLEALREHWILGKGAATTRRRWSIARDVLGWGR
jgi:ABC-type amino acid transport substrate-binding protein